MPAERWIADRVRHFDSSGIRRMFDLARTLKNPVNLSIGQPDFPVPEPIKAAMERAVAENRNGYTPTEGIAPLIDRLQADIVTQFGHADRQVLVTSGTSGALNLALQAIVNPGDEVIYFDPWFAMYPALVALVGGVPTPVSAGPGFQIDLEAVAAAITPRTRMLIVNSPCNPTGICYPEDQLRGLAELCERHSICLVSDEIYSRFVYDSPHRSAARWNEQALVIDGFSKSWAMTGWRVGWIHGPAALIGAMKSLQQFTFVCAPAPAQWAALAALDVDMQPQIDHFRQRRDRVVKALSGHYELSSPGGAFYVFPRLPWGNGESFLRACIDRELLVIPGKIFSAADTHFRLSIAVADETLDRGMELLVDVAQNVG